MDIKLNGEMDGIEAIENIIEQQDIPFIFMTGNTDEKTAERAMNINPNDYLHKPVDETLLHIVIQRIFTWALSLNILRN